MVLGPVVLHLLLLVPGREAKEENEATDGNIIKSRGGSNDQGVETHCHVLPSGSGRDGSHGKPKQEANTLGESKDEVGNYG